MGVTEHALMMTFRVCLLEIPVAAVNAFVLMDRLYAPRVGAQRAHQVAMSTRIVYLFGFAYLLVRWAGHYSMLTLLYAGLFWMALMLAFEWVG